MCNKATDILLSSHSGYGSQVQNSNGYVRNVVTCGGVKPSEGWSSRSVMFSSNPLFVTLDDPFAADERESRSAFKVMYPKIFYN